MSELGDLLRRTAIVRPSPAKPKVEWWSDALPAVGHSADLDRVLALPRRPLPEAPVDKWTEALRLPSGMMRLKPLQALALEEMSQIGGLLGPIEAGGGKTLIALLAPRVMRSRKAVLLVPAGLRDQVKRLLYAEYVRHWRLPTLVNVDVAYPSADPECLLWVIGYSDLQSQKEEKREFLTRVQPDLVICDEAHSVARYSAARTKRFRHYFKARPQTRLVALSGTLISRSVREANHLAKLSLRSGSPYPHDWVAQEEWARVLDPSDKWTDAERERAAGKLGVLRSAPDEPIRKAFRRRVVETPGVVASSELSIGTSLLIREVEVSVPKDVSAALSTMADTWETPWGEVITDSLGYFRYVRQLSCGLNYRRTWPRQEPLEIRKEWLEARAEWNREVRSFLNERSRPGMDSPGLLALAASSGKWGAEKWPRWDAIRHSARPDKEDVWLSDFLVQAVCQWGSKHTGVIWYEHSAFGRAVAKAGGFPLYQAGDDGIDDEDGSRTVVASIPALHQGKNLQQWSRQLITAMPTPAKMVEQLLARLHRQGQKADVVETDVFLHTEGLREAFRKTLEVARFLAETQGPQRVLYADKALSNGVVT